EQRSPRRRAQRCGGVRSGEQDSFGGQLIQPRARHVGVTVHPEIAAQIVPVHEQHVVAPRVCRVLVCVCAADRGHLLSLGGPTDDVIGCDASARLPGRVRPGQQSATHQCCGGPGGPCCGGGGGPGGHCPPRGNPGGRTSVNLG